MSQDPNQDPYSGYGSSPENPYGAPSGNPYGVPPENPYGVPPQNPYQAPQNPYGVPPTGYGDPNQGYGYTPSSPLPLGQALQQLLQQYIRVITRPSMMTFTLEKGKAAWDIVWVQLLLYAVIYAVLDFFARIILPRALPATGISTNPINSAAIQAMTAMTASTSIGSIVLIPLFFFIGVGILWLIAKIFGGDGTFLEQSYTTLLWSVPLGTITHMIGVILIIGLLIFPSMGVLIALIILTFLIALPITVYEIVLNVFSIMAVHRLSGGKATAVVLIIPIAVVVLFLGCFLCSALVGILAGTMH